MTKISIPSLACHLAQHQAKSRPGFASLVTHTTRTSLVMTDTAELQKKNSRELTMRIRFSAIQATGRNLTVRVRVHHRSTSSPHHHRLHLPRLRLRLHRQPQTHQHLQNREVHIGTRCSSFSALSALYGGYVRTPLIPQPIFRSHRRRIRRSLQTPGSRRHSIPKHLLHPRRRYLKRHSIPTHRSPARLQCLSSTSRPPLVLSLCQPRATPHPMSLTPTDIVFAAVGSAISFNKPTDHVSPLPRLQ